MNVLPISSDQKRNSMRPTPTTTRAAVSRFLYFVFFNAVEYGADGFADEC